MKWATLSRESAETRLDARRLVERRDDDGDRRIDELTVERRDRATPSPTRQQSDGENQQGDGLPDEKRSDEHSRVQRFGASNVRTIS